jgi:hypothetical protein
MKGSARETVRIFPFQTAALVSTWTLIEVRFTRETQHQEFLVQTFPEFLNGFWR